MLSAVEGSACDEDEVLSANSSPEEPSKKRAKKEWGPSKPAPIIVIDVEEQTKHVYSDEGSPDSVQSPPFKMTETGVELQHPHAYAGEFLVEREANHAFGGRYPQCIKALKELHKSVKGELNASTLGLAKFAGWVRSVAQRLASPLLTVGPVLLCAGCGLAEGRARRVERTRMVATGLVGPRCCWTEIEPTPEPTPGQQACD